MAAGTGRSLLRVRGFDDGDGEAFAALARRFVESVSGPVSLDEFPVESGGGAHCQVGNPAELAVIAYDWLEGL